MSSPDKRRQSDVRKLMMSNYDVTSQSNSMTDFHVRFCGPKDSPYEGGEWKVHVRLPAQYPFKSPSIGFENTIYHPNIDERSGTVCLDVINQTWSPMFELVNIFDVFLPQLLQYPNATDPLNGDAAALYMKDQEQFAVKCRAYVQQYASDVVTMDDDDSSDEDSDDVDSVRNLQSKAAATAAAATSAAAAAEADADDFGTRTGSSASRSSSDASSRGGLFDEDDDDDDDDDDDEDLLGGGDLSDMDDDF